jgi:hypothetical protein
MRILKCIYPLLVICICFFPSCESPKESKKFFDIPSYFKEEIHLIKANFTEVNKTYVYNGDTSRKELKVVDIDWEKEFAFFLEADINKPAYYANMKQIPYPSHAFNDSITKTAYGTESKKLNIQFVEVVSHNEKVLSILIRMSKSNLISNTSLEVFYEKDKKYTIVGVQQINNLGDMNTFFIEGKFK